MERGEAPKTATRIRATSERADAARTDLEHAIPARAEVAELAGQAEQATTEAEAQVKEAARGVIRLRASELQAEMHALTAKTEARRDEPGCCPPSPTAGWAVRWPEAAAALLADPEANFELDAAPDVFGTEVPKL